MVAKYTAPALTKRLIAARQIQAPSNAEALQRSA